MERTKTGYPALAAVLKRHRKEKDLSLRDLARASGVDVSFISRIELGHRSMGFATLNRLAAILGEDFRQETLEVLRHVH